MQRQFAALASAQPFNLDPRQINAGWELLQSAYNQTWRHYHTFAHIADLLNLLRQLPPHNQPASSPLLQMAIWWHDLADERGRLGAVQESAAAAHRFLPPACAPVVSRLILATDHITGLIPADPDAALLHDLDLAILASAPDAYANYLRHIRAEYPHVTDLDFHNGRHAFLRTLLARPHLYHTPAFRQTHEANARQNLTIELAAPFVHNP